MWLTEFREAHGLSIEQLGWAVRMAGKRKEPQIFIRDTTLLNLEREPGYLVIPAFADLIAEVCGATPEQRDALTLPRYAGRWRPTGESGEMAEALQACARKRAPAKPAEAPRIGGNPPQIRAQVTATTEPPSAAPCSTPKKRHQRRAVVVIDWQGRELGRYQSIGDAAAETGIGRTLVHAHCCMRGDVKSHMTRKSLGFVFADEWAAMTPAQREKAGMKQIPAEEPMCARGRAVIAIDTDGQVLTTYRGPSHAANRCGISKDMVLRRCFRNMKSNEFSGLMITFRFKDEWERMSEEERRADLDRTRWCRGNPSTARIRAGKPKSGHFRRAVVVIDAEGHEVGRYSMAKEAAEAMAVPYPTATAHCCMTKGYRSHFTRKGYGFFYADEWDAMSEDAKEAATLSPGR